MDTTPPTKPRGRIRDAVQALLVPPATTDADTLNRAPSPGAGQNLANLDQLTEVTSGNLAQRVAPSQDDVDRFPDEHPWAAIPFATDELQSARFGTPPTSFVAEQPTAQPAAWSRRFPLAQYVPFLVVPADTRPRRVLVRTVGAGNTYLHMIRPQTFTAAADTDGMLILAADGSPLELAQTGEVWAVADTGTVALHVLVDYSATAQVQEAARQADRMAAKVAAAMPAPCSCNGSH